MARYFIDTDDGDLRVPDEAGHELSSAHAARLIALDTLPDMARDKIPDGDRRTFTANVRDEAGQVIYTAVLTALTLQGKWSGGMPLV